MVEDTGKNYNLIIYKSEAGMATRIHRINNAGDYLVGQGLPVRQPVDTRILQLQASGRTAYAGLYNFLPGQTIPWEAYTKDHIKLVGKALGLLHTSMLGYSVDDNWPDALDECHALLVRMQSYFAQTGVRTAMLQKLGGELAGSSLESVGRLLEQTRKLTGRQPLHLDFVRGNILFSDVPTPHALYLDQPDGGPFISGILDLEKAAIGPPVLDVARTLAFLLVDCKYKPADKTTKYFVQSGYQKRGGQPLDGGQLRLLKPLVRFYILHDFYKFLRHNPYESLAANEHYVRTRDILAKGGIIKLKLVGGNHHDTAAAYSTGLEKAARNPK